MFYAKLSHTTFSFLWNIFVCACEYSSVIVNLVRKKNLQFFLVLKYIL